MKRTVQRLIAIVALSLSLTPMLARAEPGADRPRYATPLEAMVALAAAVRQQDNTGLLKIFGPDAQDILHTDDPIQDRKALERFRDAMDAKLALLRQSDGSVTLELGTDDWPFPIPLKRDAQGWYFDAAAGREELLNRRIGANELHTLGVVRAYVDAQYEYAKADPDGNGKPDYAQRLLSSEGKKDGLYWPVAAGGAQSPMGPLVAAAAEEGYRRGTGDSYHGYRYKLLTAQGDAAPGGQRSYLQDGTLSGGFGLVAYPAEYGVSGIMTFIVNQQGVVFQKDLGEDTARLAPATTAYDPGEGWLPTGDAFADADLAGETGVGD